MEKTFAWTILELIMQKEKEYYPNYLYIMSTSKFKSEIVDQVLALEFGYSKEHIEDIVNVVCTLERAVSESRALCDQIKALP